VRLYVLAVQTFAMTKSGADNLSEDVMAAEEGILN
jgi:hypothetical protein